MSDGRNRHPQVTFRIPEDDLDTLNSYVAATGKARSEVLRIAVARVIAEDTDVTTEMSRVA